VPRAGGRERPAKRRDVHERALGLLAVRQRSRRELERRLVAAGFGVDEVAVELRRLEQVGLIDDLAFARAVVEHAVQRRGEGRRVVARRLALAGVDAGISGEVLGDLTEHDEGERALALAESRVARLAGLAPDTALSRLSGFLSRRGYPPDVARRSARRALALETFED
jgi:regulatory protein